MLVEYNPNNSGGSWWLKDEDWKALEKAGWLVVWAGLSFDYKDGGYQFELNGLPKLKKGIVSMFAEKDSHGVYRHLGSLARYAFNQFDSIKHALEEFEKVTGQNVMDEGCDCCGAPHSFRWPDGYCSGEDCGKYLYGKDGELSKRELLEKRQKGRVVEEK